MVAQALLHAHLCAKRQGVGSRKLLKLKQPCDVAEPNSIDEPLLEHDRQNFEPTTEEPSTSTPRSSAVVPHSINRLDWEQLLANPRDFLPSRPAEFVG